MQEHTMQEQKFDILLESDIIKAFATSFSLSSA